jgi:hypothetical protein
MEALCALWFEYKFWKLFGSVDIRSGLSVVSDSGAVAIKSGDGIKSGSLSLFTGDFNEGVDGLSGEPGSSGSIVLSAGLDEKEDGSPLRLSSGDSRRAS